MAAIETGAGDAAEIAVAGAQLERTQKLELAQPRRNLAGGQRHAP